MGKRIKYTQRLNPWALEKEKEIEVWYYATCIGVLLNLYIFDTITTLAFHSLTNPNSIFKKEKENR